tara:strand:+ start:403 stop:735 length:333 start_codon:yes stop_codon:yes gene_type:complete
MNYTTILNENDNILHNTYFISSLIVIIMILLISLILLYCKNRIRRNKLKTYPPLLLSTNHSLKRTKSLPVVFENVDINEKEEVNKHKVNKSEENKEEQTLYPNLDGHNIL